MYELLEQPFLLNTLYTVMTNKGEMRLAYSSVTSVDQILQTNLNISFLKCR